MNIKRAIWMSVVFYIVSFILGTITGIFMEVDLSAATEIPDTVWYVGMVLTIILMVLFTSWYFRIPQTKPNAKNGFLFGITAMIVGFVLDAVIIFPSMMATDAPADMMAYYMNPFFWITLILMLMVGGVTGNFLEKQKKS